MKIGKLNVNVVEMNGLGRVFEITAPEAVTDLPDYIPNVSMAISLETARKLAAYFTKQIAAEEARIRASFDHAV